MEQHSSSPSDDWIEREAYGNEELLKLVQEREQLYVRGDPRNEDHQARLNWLKAKIRHTQDMLGINPLAGPEYPWPHDDTEHVPLYKNQSIWNLVGEWHDDNLRTLLFGLKRAEELAHDDPESELLNPMPIKIEQELRTYLSQVYNEDDWAEEYPEPPQNQSEET